MSERSAPYAHSIRRRNGKRFHRRAPLITHRCGLTDQLNMFRLLASEISKGLALERFSLLALPNWI